MDNQWYNGMIDIPSGYVKIAMENDHSYSGFSQLQNGGSFHSYVKLPEGTTVDWYDGAICLLPY